MASVTLPQAGKLSQNEMTSGVIDEIVTVNQMFERLPFDDIDGNALQYTRENDLGGAGVAGVGTTFDDATDRNPIPGETAGIKAPASFTSVTSGLTKIIGDAEVDQLIESTRSGSGNNQTSVQIASKAKHCGRIFQHMLANGTGAANQFVGLINLVTAAQTRTPATNGERFNLDIMDEIADLVTAKDGMIDYYCMNVRERRAYRAALRALGGAGITEVMDLPSGDRVMAYNGVPVFRNDYIPIDQTQGSTTDASTIFAGTFDDGSRSNGLAGLTARRQAGINVVDVGESETKDEHIWRVKWYCGLALFSNLGLAAAPGISPTA